MSESHEAFSAPELRADDGFGALGTSDLEDHIQRRAGRSAGAATVPALTLRVV